MERYILLIFDGLCSEERSFLSNYFAGEKITSDSQQCNSSSLLYHSTYVYFLNVKKKWKKHIVWKEVSSAQNAIQLILDSCGDVSNEGKNEDKHDSSSMAECIHCLADHLPSPGTHVLDVITGCNIFANFGVSDNVELAASLHRLSEWHAAQISWLRIEATANSTLDGWLDLTNAIAIDVNSSEQRTLPFWRGAIEFKDPIATKCYKGFELGIDFEESIPILHYLSSIFNVSSSSEYLYLHPVLKATDICSFSSIPQHLILPFAFTLCLPGGTSYDSSLKLLTNIKEKNDAALILKMGYSVMNEKPKSDRALTTNKWLKMVSSGNVKYPENCLESPDKHITLAVVCSRDVTYVLRDTSSFDAQLYFSAVSTQNAQAFGHPSAGTTFGKDSCSVPFVPKTMFLSALHSTSHTLQSSEKSGNCKDLTVNDRNYLLTSFIQNFESAEKVNFGDVTAIYEEVDPSDWAERINLLQRQMRLEEERKNKGNVFMSFSPKRSRYYVSFSGDDIKKYFEPSGEAKDSKIAEPIQSLGYNINYNKDSLETVKDKKWPDILNCVYDDIYYNVTRQSEEKESFGNEMVKCYVHHETASTCNHHQSQPDAPITIQAKSMTPRKKPTNALDSSFRQAMMRPSAGNKEKFLRTAEGQSNAVISTIMKTLGVNKSPTSASHKRRIPRKSHLPVRCSPRKNSSVDYYSSSKNLNSANREQKSKVTKEKRSNSLPEILKKKLRSCIANTLESNGINIENVLFKPCFKRLFNICQVFVQDIQDNPRKLGTSQYIQEIAEEHVKPVIKFEKQKKK